MNKNHHKIEIEFRSRFKKRKYNELKKILDLHARDLGEDNKDVYFFILPDKLLKVVDNISKKTAQIVLKLNKIGKDSDFEEIEIPIVQKFVNQAVKIFKLLEITDNIIRSFQNRHNYFYKGVNVALKYSDEWGYHLEFDVVVNSKNKKTAVEKRIKKIANELRVKLMTNKELAEFTRKAEARYKKKQN